MSLSVKLQRRSVIADIGNLLEVRLEERADRLECLDCWAWAQMMRDPTIIPYPLGVNAAAEGYAAGVWANLIGRDGDGSQLGLLVRRYVPDQARAREARSEIRLSLGGVELTPRP